MNVKMHCSTAEHDKFALGLVTRQRLVNMAGRCELNRGCTAGIDADTHPGQRQPWLTRPRGLLPPRSSAITSEHHHTGSTDFHRSPASWERQVTSTSLVRRREVRKLIDATAARRLARQRDMSTNHHGARTATTSRSITWTRHGKSSAFRLPENSRKPVCPKWVFPVHSKSG